jgi:hypothetical protein
VTPLTDSPQEAPQEFLTWMAHTQSHRTPTGRQFNVLHGFWEHTTARHLTAQIPTTARTLKYSVPASVPKPTARPAKLTLEPQVPVRTPEE